MNNGDKSGPAINDAQAKWKKINAEIQAGRIDTMTISERDLLLVVSEGNTIAHLLARGNFLHRMRKLILTKEVLAARNDRGEVPMEVFTLIEAAKDCKLTGIPLSPTDMKRDLGSGNTIAHIAARHGCLDQIPAHLLTEEIMNLPNDSGLTPRQIGRLPAASRRAAGLENAAHSGKLDVATLTTEDLRLPNKRGWTLAHTAIKVGIFPKIPAKLLTFEVLTQKFDGHLSVYRYALRNCFNNHVPKPISDRCDQFEREEAMRSLTIRL